MTSITSKPSRSWQLCLTITDSIFIITPFRWLQWVRDIAYVCFMSFTVFPMIFSQNLALSCGLSSTWATTCRAGASTEHTSMSTGKSVLEYNVFSIFMFIILGKTSTWVVLAPALATSDCLTPQEVAEVKASFTLLSLKQLGLSKLCYPLNNWVFLLCWVHTHGFPAIYGVHIPR